MPIFQDQSHYSHLEVHGSLYLFDEVQRDAILDSTELTCSFHLRSLDRRAPTSLNVCTQLIVLVSSGSFRTGPIIVSILQPLTFIHASCDCSIRAGYIQLVADLATLSDCNVVLSRNLCAMHEVCRSCAVHLSHFSHSTDALHISIVTKHAQKNCQTARLKSVCINHAPAALAGV